MPIPSTRPAIPAPEEHPTLTVAEAAAALGISRSSGFQAAACGQIPTLRIGKRLLVPTAALRAMLGLDQ